MSILTALLFLAASPPPDCPGDELSCGKQRPVVSDGRRPFINDEMGLAAIFPAGSRVCITRSGNAARGFYAWYGKTESGCPERGDIPATSMGISSSFNATDYTSLHQAAGRDCRPLSQTIQARLGEARLSIAMQPSLVCERLEPDGATTIYVYAMAGRAGWNPRVARTIYFASLGTRGAPQADDLAMFRTFLSRLRVGLN